MKAWECFQIPDTTWPSWKALLIFTSLGAHVSITAPSLILMSTINIWPILYAKTFSLLFHVLFLWLHMRLNFFLCLLANDISILWVGSSYPAPRFLSQCYHYKFILNLHILRIAKILLVLICFLFLSLNLVCDIFIFKTFKCL